MLDALRECIGVIKLLSELGELRNSLNLRGYNNYSAMSFFFNKDESQENLQYDDTAFLHFSISVCTLTCLVFLALIYRDIRNNRIPHLKKIQKMRTFQTKLQSSYGMKKSYFSTWDFLWKIGVVLACVVFGLYSFASIREDSKMIGFDPNQILGVPLDADLITIKKAYRKLALLHHPDRNINNPEVAAKFIQISKAYECLTDEQAKQKCKKFGNPDGTASYKVGIGLPRFMIDVGNQYFILIPIFLFLLVVVPRAFINWSNKIKPMDANGNLLVNYGTLHSLITPNINPITFSVIFGSMKELDAVFSEKKSLDEQASVGFKNLLIQTRSVTEEQANAIQPHILFRIYTTYLHMANRQKHLGIFQMVPQVCHKIMMFTLHYAQKMYDQQPLNGNPNWIRNYLGNYPTKLSSFFSKQMFNPSMRLGDTRSIQFLDLTPEEELMARNIPIGNLHQNLLWDDEKINSLVLNFSEDRQKYIKEQIDCLPALKVECRVLLGDEEVKEMTIDDFAILQIKVLRKKPTPGYVLSKQYPFLVKQQFNLMLSFNSNNLFFSAIEFPKNKNEIVFKCPHRQSFARNMTFDVAVMSNNYPNMDIETSFEVAVLGRIQNRRVDIHPDDLNLEKLPKNFFQSLASMDAYNEEDRELSEGSDDENQQKPMRKEKVQTQASHNCGCGDDHQEQHRPSFREEEPESDHEH